MAGCDAICDGLPGATQPTVCQEVITSFHIKWQIKKLMQLTDIFMLPVWNDHSIIIMIFINLWSMVLWYIYVFLFTYHFQCGYTFCFDCKESWHMSMTCEEYKEVISDSASGVRWGIVHCQYHCSP